jgi:hypothetical protein
MSVKSARIVGIRNTPPAPSIRERGSGRNAAPVRHREEVARARERHGAVRFCQEARSAYLFRQRTPTLHESRSLIRLASMLAIEQNDEWLVGRRDLSAASLGPLLEERPHRHTDQEVLELQPA